MKQVSECGKTIFVCLRKHLLFHQEFREKLGKPMCRSGLAIWPIQSPRDLLFSIPQACGGMKLRRYLDRFYLLVPMKNSSDRKELFGSFFGLIGQEYETLVDIDRNKENIENLLRLLARHLSSLDTLRAVDYGCGTGLSLEIARRHGVRVTGYDSCSIMRSIAKRRGMSVLDELEFAAQPARSFDAAFSSYVFHLLPEDDSLGVLFRVLKPGGVLAANFHKNTGRTWADRYLHMLGFRVSAPRSFAARACHGSYVAYVKPT